MCSYNITPMRNRQLSPLNTHPSFWSSIISLVIQFHPRWNLENPTKAKIINIYTNKHDMNLTSKFLSNFSKFQKQKLLVIMPKRLEMHKMQKLQWKLGPYCLIMDWLLICTILMKWNKTWLIMGKEKRIDKMGKEGKN